MRSLEECPLEGPLGVRVGDLGVASFLPLPASLLVFLPVVKNLNLEMSEPDCLIFIC